MGGRPPDENPEGTELRSGSRVRLLEQVVIWSGRVEGAGSLRDLSMKGARVEEASPQMKSGTRLKLAWGLRENGSPLRIPATVVRETDTGFAVEFLDLSDEVKNWLQQVISAAKVRDPD